MSGDLELICDLGKGTKYVKHWNYNGTHSTVKRSTSKGLHSADRHHEALALEVARLASELQQLLEKLEEQSFALRQERHDHDHYRLAWKDVSDRLEEAEKREREANAGLLELDSLLGQEFTDAINALPDSAPKAAVLKALSAARALAEKDAGGND